MYKNNFHSDICKILKYCITSFQLSETVGYVKTYSSVTENSRVIKDAIFTIRSFDKISVNPFANHCNNILRSKWNNILVFNDSQINYQAFLSTAVTFNTLGVRNLQISKRNYTCNPEPPCSNPRPRIKDYQKRKAKLPPLCKACPRKFKLTKHKSFFSWILSKLGFNHVKKKRKTCEVPKSRKRKPQGNGQKKPLIPQPAKVATCSAECDVKKTDSTLTCKKKSKPCVPCVPCAPPPVCTPEPPCVKQCTPEPPCVKQCTPEPPCLKQSLPEPPCLKQSMPEPPCLKQSMPEPPCLKQSKPKPPCLKQKKIPAAPPQICPDMNNKMADLCKKYNLDVIWLSDHVNTEMNKKSQLKGQRCDLLEAIPKPKPCINSVRPKSPQCSAPKLFAEIEVPCVTVKSHPTPELNSSEVKLLSEPKHMVSKFKPVHDGLGIKPSSEACDLKLDLEIRRSVPVLHTKPKLTEEPTNTGNPNEGVPHVKKMPWEEQQNNVVQEQNPNANTIHITAKPVINDKPPIPGVTRYASYDQNNKKPVKSADTLKGNSDSPKLVSRKSLPELSANENVAPFGVQVKRAAEVPTFQDSEVKVIKETYDKMNELLKSQMGPIDVIKRKRSVPTETVQNGVEKKLDNTIYKVAEDGKRVNVKLENKDDLKKLELFSVDLKSAEDEIKDISEDGCPAKTLHKGFVEIHEPKADGDQSHLPPQMKAFKHLLKENYAKTDLEDKSHSQSFKHVITEMSTKHKNATKRVSIIEPSDVIKENENNVDEFQQLFKYALASPSRTLKEDSKLSTNVPDSEVAPLKNWSNRANILQQHQVFHGKPTRYYHGDNDSTENGKSILLKKYHTPRYELKDNGVNKSNETDSTYPPLSEPIPSNVKYDTYINTNKSDNGNIVEGKCSETKSVTTPLRKSSEELQHGLCCRSLSETCTTSDHVIDKSNKIFKSLNHYRYKTDEDLGNLKYDRASLRDACVAPEIKNSAKSEIALQNDLEPDNSNFEDSKYKEIVGKALPRYLVNPQTEKTDDIRTHIKTAPKITNKSTDSSLIENCWKKSSDFSRNNNETENLNRTGKNADALKEIICCKFDIKQNKDSEAKLERERKETSKNKQYQLSLTLSEYNSESTTSDPKGTKILGSKNNDNIDCSQNNKKKIENPEMNANDKSRNIVNEATKATHERIRNFTTSAYQKSKDLQESSGEICRTIDPLFFGKDIKFEKSYFMRDNSTDQNFPSTSEELTHNIDQGKSRSLADNLENSKINSKVNEDTYKIFQEIKAKYMNKQSNKNSFKLYANAMTESNVDKSHDNNYQSIMLNDKLLVYNPQTDKSFIEKNQYKLNENNHTLSNEKLFTHSSKADNCFEDQYGNRMFSKNNYFNHGICGLCNLTKAHDYKNVLRFMVEKYGDERDHKSLNNSQNDMYKNFQDMENKYNNENNNNMKGNDEDNVLKPLLKNVALNKNRDLKFKKLETLKSKPVQHKGITIRNKFKKSNITNEIKSKKGTTQYIVDAKMLDKFLKLVKRDFARCRSYKKSRKQQSNREKVNLDNNTAGLSTMNYTPLACTKGNKKIKMEVPNEIYEHFGQLEDRFKLITCDVDNPEKLHVLLSHKAQEFCKVMTELVKLFSSYKMSNDRQTEETTIKYIQMYQSRIENLKDTVKSLQESIGRYFKKSRSISKVNLALGDMSAGLDEGKPSYSKSLRKRETLTFPEHSGGYKTNCSCNDLHNSLSTSCLKDKPNRNITCANKKKTVYSSETNFKLSRKMENDLQNPLLDLVFVLSNSEIQKQKTQKNKGTKRQLQ